MSRFYFDVYDGRRAHIDDFGDVFSEAEEAADQAIRLINDFLSSVTPGDGAKDFGVAVRDDHRRDVYRAALMFRDAYPDPNRPGAARRDPTTLSVTDPTDIILQSREARRRAQEIQLRLQDALMQSQDAVMQSRQAREQSQEARRRRTHGEVVEPVTGFSLGVSRRAA